MIYDQLAATTPSPIVELNRAVAISFADRPAAGLAIVDELANLPALEAYHLVPAVRADFLSRLGRRDEARAELERAADPPYANFIGTESIPPATGYGASERV